MKIKRLLTILIAILFFTSFAVHGAIVNGEYDFTTYDNEGFNLLNGNAINDINMSRTNRIELARNSDDNRLYFSANNFSHVLFYDSKNVYKGYSNGAGSTLQLSSYISDVAYNGSLYYVEIPDNVRKFALMNYNYQDTRDLIAYTHPSIDVLAYNNLTYREIFESNELMTTGDYSQGIGYDFTMGNVVYNELVDDNVLSATWNQLVKNGSDFVANWSLTNATGVITNGVYTFTADTLNGRLSQKINIEKHTYVIIAKFKTDSNQVSFNFTNLIDYGPENYHSGSGEYEVITKIIDFSSYSSNTNGEIRIKDTRTSGFTPIDVEYIMAIDVENLVSIGLTDSQIISLFENIDYQTTGTHTFAEVNGLSLPNYLGYPKYEIGGIADDDTTQRFGVDYNDIVKNATSWSINRVLSNTHNFELNLESILHYKTPNLSTDITNSVLIIENDIYEATTYNLQISNDKENIFSIGYELSGAQDIVAIRVNKITYPNSASFEAYLQANDVKLIYELDTYITTNRDKFYYSYDDNVLYNVTDILNGAEITLEEFETLLDFYETYKDVSGLTYTYEDIVTGNLDYRNIFSTGIGYNYPLGNVVYNNSIGKNLIDMDFTITTTAGISNHTTSSFIYQPSLLDEEGYYIIPLEKNTDYALSFITSSTTLNNGVVAIKDYYTGDTLLSYGASGRTFNSGDYDLAKVYFKNDLAIEDITFYNMQLEKGTVPTIYNAYELNNYVGNEKYSIDDVSDTDEVYKFRVDRNGFFLGSPVTIGTVNGNITEYRVGESDLLYSQLLWANQSASSIVPHQLIIGDSYFKRTSIDNTTLASNTYLSALASNDYVSITLDNTEYPTTGSVGTWKQNSGTKLIYELSTYNYDIDTWYYNVNGNYVYLLEDIFTYAGDITVTFMDNVVTTYEDPYEGFYPNYYTASTLFTNNLIYKYDDTPPPPNDFNNDFNDSIDNLGIDTPQEEMFLAFTLMIAVGVALGFVFKTNTAVVIIAELGLIFIFTVLGWFSIWFIVIVAFSFLLLIILKALKGGSRE